MKRHTTKHQEQEQQQIAGQVQNSDQQSAVEFASAETMLRHDADQIVVPPAVAERLQRSIEREPGPTRSWWRRVFGGT
jgi:hypothetical protein